MSDLAGRVRRKALKEFERVVFIGDVHIPFQSKPAVELALSFIRYYKPHKIFLIGDILDFYAISRHERDPRRTGLFQEELDEGRAFFGQVRRAAPKAEIDFLEGNHEDRLKRYLWKHPEISGLRNLQLPVLLSLEELNIHYHPYGKIVEYYDLFVEHGDVARNKSAYSAAGMMSKRFSSGITGHTHRLGSYHHTGGHEDWTWYENGCLCGLRPEYINGPPNWQQGFTAGHVDTKTHHVSLFQMKIKDGSLYTPHGIFRYGR